MELSFYRLLADRQVPLRFVEMERSETKSSFVIRCGTPDCDWGFSMPDLKESAVEPCYSGFRQHCVQVHGLKEEDPDAQVFLDLGKWTLTLLKA